MKKSTHLKIATALVGLLENQFHIWRFKFGIDPLLGLFPGIGDALSAFLSLYVVYVAFLYGLPLIKMLKMLLNILLDFLVGLVPVFGDVFDFFINPNTKNIKIINDYLKSNLDVIEGEIVK